jgi:uncharacterized protein (TIGR02453 family)
MKQSKYWSKKRKLEESEIDNSSSSDSDVDGDSVQSAEKPDPDEEVQAEAIDVKTLDFLAELADNNERDWFNDNKQRYLDGKANYENFLSVILKLLKQYDQELPSSLGLKDIMFRLYRDVRFSKDKTPYKPRFAAVISNTGKKGPYGGYWVIVNGNGCRVGAGYFPYGDRDISSTKFARLRDEIYHDSSRFKSRLTKIQELSKNKVFKASYEDEDSVVQEFIDNNKEQSLKRCPAGYQSSHKDAQLLMLRSFTIHRQLDRDEVVKGHSAIVTARLLGELTPWVHYLNRRLVANTNN